MTPRIYVDANAFIEAIERTTSAAQALRRVFRSDSALVTSELTLGEVLVHPLRDGRANTVRAYEQFIAPRPGLTVVPVGRPLLLRAAALRAATQSLKLPDAIHLATAEATACDHFLSNDLRLPLSPGLTPIPFDPTLIDGLLP